MTSALGRMRAAAIALLAGCAATTATAQTADGRIEEVLVTAQKRAENLQQVPVAISVVSGRELERANVNSAEQLIERVPALTFRKGNTNKDSALTIRGVGTISFASGVEPSVSTVIDGVVYARGGQATADFLDVDRIEVLRGPQGTLFGKNASAGVLNIVTRDPTADPHGYVDASYFEGNEYRFRGNYSGPLSPTLGGSITAFFAHFDGNATNTFNGHTVNGYEHAGVRAKLQWTPTDNLKATLIGDYSHNDDNGYADAIGIVRPAAFNDVIFVPSLAPVVPGPTNRNISNDLDPMTRDTNTGLSLQVDWTVGRFTITSISAYRSWKNEQVRDGDFRGGSPTFVNTGIAAGDNLSHDFGTLNFDQVTQELRIASPTGQFLEYVGGLYYYFTREGDYFNRRVVQCTASTLPANAAGLTPCAPGASTYLSRLGEANFGTELENYAGFGQATLNFTPSLRAIGGLRWTHDSVDYKHSRVSPSTVAFPGVQPSFSSVGSTAHNGISGKAGLQYDLTDRVMAYASYTRGYKGPAINVFFNMQPNDTKPIAPETSNAYEVGLKSRLLDGRLVLNLAGFHTVYDNFQANFFDTVAGQVVTRLTNAGTVSTRGVEADFTLMPVERLRFTGGAAYTDAHIDQFNCPAPAAPNCAAAVNGKPLPFSPKFKTSITADYLVPLPAAPFDLELNSSYVWQSKQQYDINQAPDSVQESYGLWDASVSFVSHDERYRLSFVAKNITDQFFTIIKVPNGTFTRQIVPRDAERYVGVNLRVSF